MDALGKEKPRCRYWLQGRCMNPRCPFRHGDGPQRGGGGNVWRRNPSGAATGDHRLPVKNPPFKTSEMYPDGIKTEQRQKPSGIAAAGATKKRRNCPEEENLPPCSKIDPVEKTTACPNSSSAEKTPCLEFTGDQSLEEKTPCPNGSPHKDDPPSSSAKENTIKDSTWCSSTRDKLSLLAQLHGHNQIIQGIAFHRSSSKLLSADKGGNVKVWDCVTGNCSADALLGQEVGCLVGDGPWVYAAVPNALKAWNLDSTAEQTINGPEGRVYSLSITPDYIFAGVQDGSIAVWNMDADANSFQPSASLTAHQSAVKSLVINGKRLYSSSTDTTIKIWDIGTLRCLQTLTGHADEVTSLLFWGQFLLSCSLDLTIKVWAPKESEDFEVAHVHSQEHLCFLSTLY